jgi:ATP-dependent RNA helicase DDX46/PRP5
VKVETKEEGNGEGNAPNQGEGGMEIEMKKSTRERKLRPGDDELEDDDEEDAVHGKGEQQQGKSGAMAGAPASSKLSVTNADTKSKFNAAEVEEEDPLEAYMNQISSILSPSHAVCYNSDVEQATKQESFTIVNGVNGQGQFFQDLKDVPMKMETPKVITYDDLVNSNIPKTLLPPSRINAIHDNVDEIKAHNIIGADVGASHVTHTVMEREHIRPDVDDEDDEEYQAAFLAALRAKKPEMEEEQNQDTGVGESKGPAKQICNDEDQDDYVEFVDPAAAGAGDDDDFLLKQKKMADRKELKQVDHTTMKYEPFRKSFYIECKEIAQMNDEEVEEYRKAIGDIKVRGKECPKPIKTWYQCGLDDKILRILIDKKRFFEPFPIQKQAVPAIMSGRDIIGIAETGSGKTLAYLLPMLRHILDQRPLEEFEGPISLIMAPTRELAFQIYNETRVYCKALNLRCVCVYGGAGIAGQLSELKRGAEIVVCTPGRMIDVLTTSNGKITNLHRVTYVVLDEADRMFDMGFEPQISKILSNIRPDRQTVMFSATFPKSVEGLAKKILTRPLEIIVGARYNYILYMCL